MYRIEHASSIAVFRYHLREQGFFDDVLLSSEERKRADSYRFEADRRRFVAGASMIREIFAAHTKQSAKDVRVFRRCPKCTGDHGRPIVQGSNRLVSVSHAGDIVYVAVGQDECFGIDVELVERFYDASELMPHILTKDELARIPEHSAEQLCYYWTSKEAIAKATTRGLELDLRLISVCPESGKGSALVDGDVREFNLLQLDEIEGHRCVLAIEQRIDSSPPSVEVRAFLPFGDPSPKW